MIRLLLTILVPLVLPTLVYFIYRAIVRPRRPASAGQAQNASDDDDLDQAAQSAPWLRLLVAGVALVGLSLVFLADYGRERPNGVYVPPQVVGDEIVPGHFVTDQEMEPGTDGALE